MDPQPIEPAAQREVRTVDLNIDPTGQSGTLLVDGQDLSRVATGVTVEWVPSLDLPRVRVDLAIHPAGLRYSGPAVVEFDVASSATRNVVRNWLLEAQEDGTVRQAAMLGTLDDDPIDAFFSALTDRLNQQDEADG